MTVTDDTQGQNPFPPNYFADDPAPDDPELAAGESSITLRMHALRIEREARRRLDAEECPPVEPPPIRGLSDLLAQPDAPTQYVIDKVAPTNSRIMLAAQYKAGKSTLVGNLIRSLADQQPFLDHYEVHQPARRIVLLDTELGRV